MSSAGCKASIVAEQLRKVAGLDVEVTVEPAPADELGLGWRTRVGYAVDPDGTAGLRRHRSHDVVAIDWCRIAAPGVVELGIPGRRWPGAAAVEGIAASTGDRALIVAPRSRRGRVVAPPDIEASVLRGSADGSVEAVRGSTRGP